MRCINNPLIPWSEAVLQNGVLQMKHGKALVESRPFFSRIPDQDILVGDRASGFARAEADDWPQLLKVTLLLPWRETDLELLSFFGERVGDEHRKARIACKQLRPVSHLTQFAVAP